MENPIDENEIELFDYLKILYRYKYFIVIVTFVSVVLAVAIATHQQPVIRESSIGIKLSFVCLQKRVLFQCAIHE